MNFTDYHAREIELKFKKCFQKALQKIFDPMYVDLIKLGQRELSDKLQKREFLEEFEKEFDKLNIKENEK